MALPRATAISRLLLPAETLGQTFLLDIAAGPRKEAERSRRIAGEATDSRLKADLMAYANELEARALLVEQSLNVVVIDPPPPGRTKS